MSLIVDVVIGALGTGLAIAGVRVVVMDKTRHLKQNYRGRTVVATAGLALLLPLGLGKAMAIATDGVTIELSATAGAPFLMAILGLIDDVYGSRHAGGLLGHARELLHGRPTTGMVKAVGGALIGVGAAALLGHRGYWMVIAGAVVALAANLANLLDLRPARTIKVWLPLAVGTLLVTDGSPGRHMLAALIGGVVVFAFYELAEVVMLGDVGANLLGAVLGVEAIAAFSRRDIATCAAALTAVTLLSEVVSFSRVIEATAPLHWLDRLGRR